MFTSVNQLAGQAELHMLQLFVQWDVNVIKPVALLRRGRLDVYVMTLITGPGPVNGPVAELYRDVSDYGMTGSGQGKADQITLGQPASATLACFYIHCIRLVYSLRAWCLLDLRQRDFFFSYACHEP